MKIKLPSTALGLLDRDLDDHQKQRGLETLPLHTRAKEAVYRLALLELPEDPQAPRDPDSIPTGIIRA